MTDETETITAPFTIEQRVALQEWQDCGWVHQLTCGECSCSLPMIPEARGMVCVGCYHVQETVPALCLTLPPDPATILNLASYEVTFFLGQRLPSAQHTFACKAASPAAAITLLLAEHPTAMLPFTIGEAAGQGEGHKPL